jgi:hypothetical protein
MPFVFQAPLHHIDFKGKERGMTLFETYANVYRIAMFQPLPLPVRQKERQERAPYSRTGM